MDPVGAKCHRRLRREGFPRQEIDRPRSPGLTWKSRLADREYITWTMHYTAVLFETNTGIGNRCDTVTVYDRKEHRPEPIRGGIDGFLIAKFAEIIGLARLEQSDIGITGAVQGNVMMVRNMT